MSKKELMFEVNFLENSKIRSEEIDGELWFSVIDAVAAVKEDMATPPKDYWVNLKKGSKLSIALNR